MGEELFSAAESRDQHVFLRTESPYFVERLALRNTRRGLRTLSSQATELSHIDHTEKRPTSLGTNWAPVLPPGVRLATPAGRPVPHHAVRAASRQW